MYESKVVTELRESTCTQVALRSTYDDSIYLFDSKEEADDALKHANASQVNLTGCGTVFLAKLPPTHYYAVGTPPDFNDIVVGSRKGAIPPLFTRQEGKLHSISQISLGDAIRSLVNG